MTTGEAILWVTVILLPIFAARWITRRERWLLVSKIVGGFVLLGALSGLATWGWFSYQERPQVLTTLNGFELGMTPLEAQLAFGKPDIDITEPNRLFVYNKYEYSDEFGQYIRFTELEDGKHVAAVICDFTYTPVFGLSIYSTEKDVIAKLGEPTYTSVRENGLAKAISYEMWNVGFTIVKGDVSNVCITLPSLLPGLVLH